MQFKKKPRLRLNSKKKFNIKTAGIITFHGAGWNLSCISEHLHQYENLYFIFFKQGQVPVISFILDAILTMTYTYSKPVSRSLLIYIWTYVMYRSYRFMRDNVTNNFLNIFSHWNKYQSYYCLWSRIVLDSWRLVCKFYPFTVTCF